MGNVLIDSIQNNKLKMWALAVDAMGIGESDRQLDEKEWNIFYKGAQEDVQNNKYSQEDLNQVLGLYTSNPGVNATESISEEVKPTFWESIAQQVKNSFCDENGKFSFLKTAVTLVEAGILAVGLYAGFGAVRSLGKMITKKGLLSKLLRRKPKVKPNASPAVAPKATATQTVTPKTNTVSANAAQQASAATSQSNQVLSTVTKNGKTIETVAIKNGQKRITKDATGRITKTEILKGGKVTRQITTDVNGKKIVTDYTYHADGAVAKTTIKYEPGSVATGRAGERLSYPDGAIKEVQYSNWEYTEVTKDLGGKVIGTNVYDCHHSLIRRKFPTPDSKGRIMIEHKGGKTIETFADGTTKIIEPNVKVVYGPRYIDYKTIEINVK